uniref:RNA-dependent RNA polymerase n=1 Tax=Riboviria sp. TaxID=2585031 RepID=A0A514D2E2_9VIRU|nr:MAG: RNA-dependent RNA polymerase [Riboviria sp.]
MLTAWQANGDEYWVPAVHADNVHNERLALLLRSLGPTPGLAPIGLERVRGAFKWFRTIANWYGGETWTHLQTAQSYAGALRRRYMEAESSLRLDGPATFRDTKLRAFLKAEKVNPMLKFQKPRMIFPRSPRYNLELASRLKPFEHWLWRKLRIRGHSGKSSRIVGKGLNQTQRAKLIKSKFDTFRRCAVVEVDGKAFEAHLDEEVLELEHSVYLRAFPRDSRLAWLLAR